MNRHPTESARRSVRTSLRRAAGLSLVELMIAIALGLIIVGAMVAVFANSSVARNEIERMSRQIENGRYAIELLSEDLRHAGFYGELNVTDLPAVGALTDAEHDPCSLDPTHWAKAMNLHVRGFDASNGGLGCLAGHNYKAGTDVIVIRRVRTCGSGDPGCAALDTNKPYVQSVLCAADPVITPPFHLALYDAAVFTLRRRGPTTTTCSVSLAPIRQYLVHIYFISTDNGDATPQPVPTLKRLELTGAGGALSWAVTPLVEGIEQLNIDYGVDCTAAGVAGYGNPDSYASDPATVTGGTCTSDANRWMNVMTARIALLARNIEPSPRYTDVKTYQLGSLAVAAPNDSYRRHVYTAVVRMNNPAGRRDRP